MTNARMLEAALVALVLIAVVGHITDGPRAAWVPAATMLVMAGRLVRDHYSPSRWLRISISTGSITLVLATLALGFDEAWRTEARSWTALAACAIVLLALSPTPNRTVWHQFLGRPTPPTA